MGEPLGLGYGTDSKDGTIYIDVPTYPPPAPPSPDWTPGSLPIFPSHSNVSSPVSSPLISLTVPSPVATPTATIPVDEDQFIEVGAQLELYAAILQDHTQRLDSLPPTLFAEIDRDVGESLEQEQERAVMTFRALWMPVLALEAWAGHVDTRMTSMSWAGYDDHRLVHDLLVQQAALLRELQEMRGRVIALEQERDRLACNDAGVSSVSLVCIRADQFYCFVRNTDGKSGFEVFCAFREVFPRMAKNSSRSAYVKTKAYLVVTDTESKPIEDLGTEWPKSPHVVASPISFPDSTPPIGYVEETAHLTVRVQPTMSPGYFARIAEVAAMSDVAFRKRFRSPYESSPSPSPTLPVRKRYRGTSELVLSTDSEADELGNEEDSLDSDSGSEGAEDEGPAAGDGDPCIRDEGFSLGEDEAVPEGQQRAAPVVETAVGEPLGLGYGALRRQELAAEEDQRYSTFEVGQGSGSAPEPERL
ncbi:hypothetical protein Tco_0507475 [Tanacetum coccineum]